MWMNLSRNDLHRAKDELERRRVEIEARHRKEMKSLEAKHAEERNSLEATLNQLREMERTIDAFVQEYMRNARDADSLEPSATETQPPATLVEHLAEPPQVEVIATNWGNARFTPAEAITGRAPSRDWGE